MKVVKQRLAIRYALQLLSRKTFNPCKNGFHKRSDILAHSIASQQAVVSAAKVDLQTRGFADDFQSRTLIALFPVAKPAASVSVTSHLRILFLCFAGFLIEGCVVHDPTVVIFFVQHEPRFSIKHCIGPRRVMENDVLKAVKVEGT